jgi:uncharacterized protein YlxP (DUF503 family)
MNHETGAATLPFLFSPDSSGFFIVPRSSFIVTMVVVVALFELHIEYAQSLKDKRQVVRSLKDRLRHTFHVSANEVAFQDLLQRARLAVSFVTDRHDSADSLLDRIQNFVESQGNAVLAGWTSEKLDFDEEADL